MDEHCVALCDHCELEATAIISEFKIFEYEDVSQPPGADCKSLGGVDQRRISVL